MIDKDNTVTYPTQVILLVTNMENYGIKLLNMNVKKERLTVSLPENMSQSLVPAVIKEAAVSQDVSEGEKKCLQIIEKCDNVKVVETHKCRGEQCSNYGINLNQCITDTFPIKDMSLDDMLPCHYIYQSLTSDKMDNCQEIFFAILVFSDQCIFDIRQI